MRQPRSCAALAAGLSLALTGPLVPAPAALADGFQLRFSTGKGHAHHHGRHHHWRPHHWHPHHRAPHHRYGSYYYPPPRVIYAPPVMPAPPPVAFAPPPLVAVPASPLYRGPGGRYCREYRSSAPVGGLAQLRYGTACLQPDGTWRVVD